MSELDVDQWLEQWVEDHLQVPGSVDHPAEMQTVAQACRAAAMAAGVTTAELNVAADGNLETYLVERHNALAAVRARDARMRS